MAFFTPNFPSLEKIFQQADCNIRPSTLFGISVGLAAAGTTVSWMAGVQWFLAPIAGVIMFLVPLAPFHDGRETLAAIAERVYGS